MKKIVSPQPGADQKKQQEKGRGIWAQRIRKGGRDGVKQLSGYCRRVNGKRKKENLGFKGKKRRKKDEFAAGRRALTNPDRSRWPWPELKPRASTAASRAFLPLAASGWHGQEL
jgi:hypothetical protein